MRRALRLYRRFGTVGKVAARMRLSRTWVGRLLQRGGERGLFKNPLLDRRLTEPRILRAQRLYLELGTLGQVAARIRTSTTTIQNLFKRGVDLGMFKNPLLARRTTDDQLREACESYRTLGTIEAAARRLRLRWTAVRWRILEGVRRGLFADPVPAPKDLDPQRFHRFVKKKMSQARMAKELGMSQAYVSVLLRRYGFSEEYHRAKGRRAGAYTGNS